MQCTCQKLGPKKFIHGNKIHSISLSPKEREKILKTHYWVFIERKPRPEKKKGGKERRVRGNSTEKTEPMMIESH
jgi:hypothetical protein